MAIARKAVKYMDVFYHRTTRANKREITPCIMLQAIKNPNHY